MHFSFPDTTLLQQSLSLHHLVNRSLRNRQPHTFDTPPIGVCIPITDTLEQSQATHQSVIPCATQPVVPPERTHQLEGETRKRPPPLTPRSSETSHVPQALFQPAMSIPHPPSIDNFLDSIGDRLLSNHLVTLGQPRSITRSNSRLRSFRTNIDQSFISSRR